MTAARRALLVVALVLVGAAAPLAGTAPAGAHNSRTAFDGTYGPYDVVATIRDVDDTSDVGLELDLVVRTVEGKDPVEDATVRVEAVPDGGDGTGPVAVERYGNVYRSTLDGGDVERWAVAVTIDGPVGVTEIDEDVPGPATLHGSALGTRLTSAPSTGWLVVVLAGLAALAVAGFTRWWRTATFVGGGVLLAACATALVGSLSGSSGGGAGRVVAVVPPLLSAALLVAGMVLTARDRADARALVFAGGAGLAATVGLVNRDVLTSADASTVLSPVVAQATTALALGLGGGLALMVLVLSRDDLRALVGRRSPHPTD